MKAIALTSKQRQLISALAEKEFEEKINDAIVRSHYLMFAAMVEAGLSPRTVNKVADMLVEVSEKYKDYKTDQIADYAFCSRLNAAGIKVPITKKEQ